MTADLESEAPGWDAIDKALNTIYPGVEPYHLATMLKWRLGGPDPLDGVSIYDRGDHWHYVSYGMSELYEKESDDPDESGWGFEFTFRAARRDGETEPPRWAVGLLQNLGRYVFTTGNVFGRGHYMDLNGPISLDNPQTRLCYVGFALDPELGEIATPHGSLAFLQVIGLTEAEYDAAQAWSATSLFGVLSEALPLLVTDIDRSCTLDAPAVAAAVAQGIARDGSSSSSSYVTQLDWTGERIVLGAHAAPRIATALKGRLPFGRPLTVFSSDRELTFEPGDALARTETDAGLTVTVPAGLLGPLADALTPMAGVTTVASGLSVEIVPTEIRDEDGNVLYIVGSPT
ncbi:suppressor of fused domain protein [Allorhizocola rhizosphaerae]|uniref:suppressor of fused domain protein n=1 Tax=Allorhizocola rhizosphaerae TaxID=1872709 RepID=UPI000E3CC114|nr:suppressor of fused domain protein [Allorhizocola rhizosphaerae]